MVFSPERPRSTRLFENTNPVEPPSDPNYDLTQDMAEKAIHWMQTQRTLAPEKPFFVWFTPGAVHGPQQVAKKWADKYKGKFDQGWEKLAATKDIFMMEATRE